METETIITLADGTEHQLPHEIERSLRLDEPGATMPDTTQRLAVDGDISAISSKPATASERAQAMASLVRDPVDMVPAEDLIVGLDCGSASMYVVPNHDIVGHGLPSLLERRALAGIVAITVRADREPVPALAILTAPGEGNVVDVLVTRLTGEDLYRGRLESRGDALEGQVWSLPEPGVAAIEIDIHASDETLTLKGASATRVAKVDNPEPATR